MLCSGKVLCVQNNCTWYLDSVLQPRKLEYLANAWCGLVAGVGAGSKHTVVSISLIRFPEIGKI